MLRLIPAPLHRQLYRFAYAMRKRWLNLRGGTLHGCSVVARDGQGRVLMVRHSYGSGRWEFPGGGIGSHEEPATAASREFAEELGCGLIDLRLLGVIEEPYHGAVNVVHVFTGLADGEPRADGREIVEARFFAREELPALGSKAERRVQMLGR